MIETKEIKKALKEKTPLFTDGTEISLSAFEFLKKLEGKELNLLFSNFPKSFPQYRPCIHVIFSCPVCKKTRSFKTTKQKIQSTRKNDTDSLCRSTKSFICMNELEVLYYFYKSRPDLRNLSLDKVCDDCMISANDIVEKEIEEFYSNPLKWVNTNTPDVPSWQWKKVVKLYTYPIGFKNIPEGYKYCGVKYKKRGSIYEEEIFDENYLNWKTIKEKTIVEKKISSVHELLNSLLGDLRYSDTTPVAHKKAIKIVELMLEGLVSNADLPSLLKHVSRESNRILDSIKRNSNPSRIFSFGKYKGMTIHEVIEIDPEYIYWALNVVEGFTLTDDEKAHYKGEEWKNETEGPSIEDQILNGLNELAKECPEKYSEKKEDESDSDSFSPASPLPF